MKEIHNDSPEDLSVYPKEVIKLINAKEYFGRMNDPVSSSYLRGPCGDSMEFYLVIENSKITRIKYFTDGCGATRACAAMAAKLADGRTIKEALSISAGDVIAGLKGLPEDHLHCSILSVSTLYRAIADYILRK
ncbi:MAG: iron-sulfur cluster assembly scaffold protein [Candidatus Omnitrophica bacterium]|nr:iron-sulfur cluster assembly scaffold protein [Candidatus Omnitrophota bacterium]MDD5552574.1 iron-sulfur cluster assembly scaffold protein [Candidatus Omnitrophota bacterium]